MWTRFLRVVACKMEALTNASIIISQVAAGREQVASRAFPKANSAAFLRWKSLWKSVPAVGSTLSVTENSRIEAFEDRPYLSVAVSIG
jgi:hypothetical protein